MQTNQQYPKKDNSFPFQSAFMFFIFNMKESFLEPQLGEVQTWRWLVLPFWGMGDGLLCFMWSRCRQDCSLGPGGWTPTA